MMYSPSLAFHCTPPQNPHPDHLYDEPEANISDGPLETRTKTRQTYLGHIRGLRQGGVQNVVYIYRKQLKEALFSRGRHSVRSVIRICPRIGSIRETPIREMIDDALVRVLFRPHEYQAESRCQKSVIATGV